MTRRQFTFVGLGAIALPKGSRQASRLDTARAATEGGDARRIGVRRNGAYWGAAPEQIDLLSGNLCFSLPLLTANSRGAKVAVRLSYNSQLWKKEGIAVRSYGQDLGMGLGWRLSIGSIRTQPAPEGPAKSYVFIDNTGAEYPLSETADGWVLTQGAYLRYDPASARLNFPDGSVWALDCISAQGEVDAGARYPTLITDSNGNQIRIRYLRNNGSSRIQDIRDARAVDQPSGRRTYLFAYDASPAARLLSITSVCGTGEDYQFSHDVQGVSEPFGGRGSAALTTMLRNIRLSDGRLWEFIYNSAGELVSATLPYGARVAWDYETETRSTGTIRSVTRRSLSLSSSVAPLTHTLDRENSHNGAVPATATLTEPGHAGFKTWTFCTDSGSPDLGLVTALEEGDSGKPLRRSSYAWKRTSNGLTYFGVAQTTIDPGTQDESQSTGEYTRDRFGNLVEKRRFGSGGREAPTVVYSYEYLADSEYIRRGICNRLVSATVTDSSGSTQLVRNQYDTTPLTPRPGVLEHDSARFTASDTVRGNLTEAAAGGVKSGGCGCSSKGGDVSYRRRSYDVTGLPCTIEDSMGWRISLNPAGNSNNAAIGVVVPNGRMDLASELRYDSALRPISFSSINGSRSSAEYDGCGRLAAVTNLDGAVRSYSYALDPPAVTTSTNGQFQKRTLDGLGRHLKYESGGPSGVLSVVEYQYAPSAGAPLGSLARKTVERGPGEEPVWLTTTWDSLGRTITQDLRTSTDAKRFEYRGKTVSVTAPGKRKKTLVYDEHGRILSVLVPNPSGGPDLATSYSYSATGKLLKVSMPRPEGEQRRSFAYDSDGRFISGQLPESGPESNSYNLDGTVAAKVDAKGQRVAYAYDSLKRLISVKCYDSRGKIRPTESATYYYDANPFDAVFSRNPVGRLTAVQWGDVLASPGQFTEMYSYSASGLLIAKRLRISRSGGHADLDLSYSRDSEGRVTAVGYPEGGPDLQYSLDSLGRLAGITAGSVSLVKGVSYDGGGRIKTLKHLIPESVNYLSEEREYDLRGRLTGITAQPEGATPIVDLRYAYGTDGLLKSEEDRVAKEETSYQYDVLGRLTSASGNDWKVGYTYDGFGNLQSQGPLAGHGPAFNVPTNAATNWLLSDQTDYDPNGNIIRLPLMDLEYDTRNRLSACHHTINGTELYSYDPMDRRVWLRTASGQEQLFLYDAGSRLLATYEIGGGAEGVPTLKLVSTNLYAGRKRMLRARGEAVVTDRLGVFAHG